MAMLSNEREAFINSKLASGQFPNREAVLEAAIDRMMEADQIVAHVMEGVDELERGEDEEYTLEEMNTLFQSFISEAEKR